MQQFTYGRKFVRCKLQHISFHPLHNAKMSHQHLRMRVHTASFQQMTPPPPQWISELPLYSLPDAVISELRSQCDSGVALRKRTDLPLELLAAAGACMGIYAVQRSTRGPGNHGLAPGAHHAFRLLLGYACACITVLLAYSKSPEWCISIAYCKVTVRACRCKGGPSNQILARFVG